MTEQGVITLGDVRDQIDFHLSWAEVDPSVDLLISDLASREQWYIWEHKGAVEGLFLHTVASGCQAISRALDRDAMGYDERREVVSRGLMILSVSPPYDFLPLQAGALAQMAFDAQMTLPERVTLDDLPVARDQLDVGHFLAATEAAFGFTLSLLHTYAAWRSDQ